MDVERAQRGHDDEVRKDERPAAGPGPPEAAADGRDPDADLDRERAGQGLADGDAFAHLLLREPYRSADHFALHLTDHRDGTAKRQAAEAKVMPHELAARHPLLGRLWGHA